MIPELLNGKEKCTIIEAMNGEAVVLKPGFRKEFKSLKGAKDFVLEKGWEINIGYVKGSLIMREIMKD